MESVASCIKITFTAPSEAIMLLGRKNIHTTVQVLLCISFSFIFTGTYIIVVVFIYTCISIRPTNLLISFPNSVYILEEDGFFLDYLSVTESCTCKSFNFFFKLTNCD